MRRRALALVLLVAAGGAVAAAQAPEKVRVTVARANVRSEPSEKAPVITQVTKGTELECRGEDGDWFQVRLPPDPRLGGVRVEAYISKKVAAAVKHPMARPPNKEVPRGNTLHASRPVGAI